MRFAACVAAVLVGLVVAPGVAFAEGSDGLGGSGASPLGGALVVGGLEEAQQVQAAQELKLSSPEAVAAREESQTKYEGLDAEQAAKLAGEAFPAVVEEPAGGPPRLLVGQSVVGYLADDVAQVELGGGKRGVVVSGEPMAVESSSGQRVPVDLALSESDGSFAPARPVVAVGIPKRLQEGVSLVGSGVSLAPVNVAGEAVGGSEGSIDGAVAFYGGVGLGSDVDVVAKPVTAGFQEDAILRSVRSPQQLAFRVGLPEGASLRQAVAGDGAVEVVREGAVLAVVLPPVAVDAAGTPVPVSMSVSGDLVTVSVEGHAGEYQFPIDVDPTVVDRETQQQTGNWVFTTDNSTYGFYWYPGEALSRVEPDPFSETTSIERSQYGDLLYTTKGESKIDRLRAETYYTEVAERNTIKSYLAIAHSSYEAGPTEVPKTRGWHEVSVGSPSFGNTAIYEVIATESATDPFYESVMYNPEVTIQQEAGPHVSMDTTEEVVNGEQNALWALVGNRWASSKSGKWGFKATATDPGLGVMSQTWSSPNASKWGYTLQFACKGAQCESPAYPSRKLKTLGSETEEELPEGEDTVELKVKDPVGLEASTGSYKVKVDDAPPRSITLSGLPSSHEIDDGQHVLLTASATDGTKPTPSSGVASIVLSVDGQQLGEPSKGCFPGECTATGEWTLSGAGYAAGQHTLTVTATDNAGNAAKAEYQFTVHHASDISVGPGLVSPTTGELVLSATDVSVGAPDGGLTVARSYGSRRLSGGSSGPLGSPWSLSLGAQASLARIVGGNMLLTSANGQQSVFVSNGKGGYTPPAGDAGLALNEKVVGKATDFLLSENGKVTTFTVPSGGGGSLWEPAISEGSGGTNATTFAYRTEGGVTEPTEELAPVPAGVSCSPTLSKGCRALSFAYGSETTAKGEGPSEWGSYTGRLKQVSFTAYEPASKEMKTKVLAEYAYDKQGRLRAEWNPQISPALKTVYGYDAEGHVTALASAGQQPWLFHYGTTASDQSPGRLLSVIRPSAASELGGGAEPQNTSVPTLSSTKPVLGTALSVSNGSWSNSPLSYSYQWERCSAAGTECVAILGATNQTYTPFLADNGHALLAQVTALNADGSVVALSAASSEVPVAAPVYSSSFGSSGTGAGQFEEPTAVAFAPTGNVWVVDAVNHRLQEFSSSDAFIETIGWGVSNGKEEFQTCTSSCKAGLSGGGAGEFANPEGVAINQSSGDIYVADSAEGHVQEFSSTGAYMATIGSPGHESGELSEAHEITLDSSGDVWVADSANDRVEEFSSGGTFIRSIGEAGKKSGQLDYPIGVALAGANVYVTDMENQRVQEFTLEGSWVREFGDTGSESEKLSDPWGIALDPLNGDLYVTSYGNSRVEAFTPEGKYIEGFGHFGSEREEMEGPAGLVVNSITSAFYIADEGDDRVDIWTPAGATQEPIQTPPTLGSSAVTTIDYQVPLSGTGVPQMTSTEVAKWGQSDDPAEATAVFPPDQPMGWPAKEYTRASIYYLDGKDRSVNVSTRTGGISTAEYNAYNDVTRTLSPDDRAAALAAGEAKSSEVSKELDTESTYNESGGEPGTELLSTLGPKHTVQLTNGTHVEARQHTVYSYNEGAPSEGGPYHLVTKMTEGAQVAGKEEAASVRTTKTSYSGQDNLGWKLHKPTSVTVEPSGLNLTHSIFYEPKTGNVTETRMPAAGAPGEEQGDIFHFQFGKSGEAEGDLKEPAGVAVNSSGDAYVLDTGNHRVEEFNAKGVLVRAFGSERLKEPRGIALDSKGDVWVANTGDSTVDVFSSTGEYKIATTSFLKAPQGVAVNAEGEAWVANTGENKISRFTYYESLGEMRYEGSFGTAGSGETQFKEPQGVAIGAEGNIYVADTGNDRIDEYKKEETHIRNFGKEGTGNGQFKAPHGIASDSAGDVWVADAGNNRVQEFSPTGTFMQTFGKEGTAEGKLKNPQGISIDTEGNEWVADTANSNVQEWTPNGTGYGSGTATAHDTQTIYYTAAENAKHSNCGEHPEWANLPCETIPAAQPTGGLPNLVRTVDRSYNMWDEPEHTEESSESTTRNTNDTYDSAGRLKTTAVTASAGTALPTVTDKYNETNGALEEQSTTTEGKTKTITSQYNTLGELTSYTDSSENTSTYEYDIDGRIKKTNDGKGTETYTYSKTTGLPTELLNEYGTSKLAFTGSYDSEGNLVTEGYPNGMNANYTYNTVDKPTSLEYKKISHCTEGSENCKWFTDTVVPSIHGQWLEQTSTFSHQAYTYDGAGRLTQVQNTPAGQGCTTRIYTYDEDTNRTSLTAREPGSEGKCATEGGTVEKHTYDQGDRLSDAGVSYNKFGDITALPATDAGGSELTSSYYVDNQVASQEQNGQTVGYTLDPDGRTSIITDTGKRAETVTQHYAGPGSTVAWTTNTASETMRNIPALNGTLGATQSNLETPVLQLTNLHGDIIATAYLSETASGLASKADTSEYGVPTTSLPPKYSWLGALDIPTELSSGVAAMGVRSYVPQIGRFLQPDPIAGGSANAYAYTFGDPVNTSDPTGASTIQELVSGHADQVGREAQEAEEAARRAAEEAAARAQAERAAIDAIMAADVAGPQYTAGGEEEWGEEEWYEEEGEYEYASYQQGGKEGHEQARIEPAILVQPLHEESSSGSREKETPGTIEPVLGGCPSTSDPCWKGKRGYRRSRVNGGPGPGGVLACTALGAGMVATGVGAPEGIAAEFACGLGTLAF